MKLYNDIIELGNLEETVVHGEPIQAIVWKEVFARIDSVRQSEFYQAASVGLKPEMVILTLALNYNNEEKIRYDGTLYEIIRVYKKDGVIELVVSALVGAVI